LQETEWKEVPGGGYPFFKFKKDGDEIAGRILGRRTQPPKDGFKEQLVIDVETKDGVFSVGCSADLKAKVSKIPDGYLFRAKRNGTKKVGKPQPMICFDVQSRPSPEAK
jgi:hypothetical protein